MLLYPSLTMLDWKRMEKHQLLLMDLLLLTGWSLWCIIHVSASVMLVVMAAAFVFIFGCPINRPI